MMKNRFFKNLTFGLLVISSTFSFGQYEVILKESDFAKLKKCTTYVVCPDFIIAERDSVKKIFNKAWTYNEIEVIGTDELEYYINKENSAFFSIVTQAHVYFTEIYFELWTIKDISKGLNSKNHKSNRIHYARIELSFDCEDEKKLKETENDSLFIHDYLYSDAKLINFKPAIIANHLKAIENKLNKKKASMNHIEVSNIKELKNAEIETLYITDNILNKKKCTKEEWLKNELMADYPFSYKFISFDDLNEKISNGESFYYAVGLTMRTGGIFSVYKSSSGECIFNKLFLGTTFYPTLFKTLTLQIRKN